VIDWPVFVDGALDTALLLGIFATAVFSIFKVGRWFQALVTSQAALQHTLDTHIIDEDMKFSSIDSKLAAGQGCFDQVRKDIARLESVCTRGANGSRP
jgi:hypothetical protein